MMKKFNATGSLWCSNILQLVARPYWSLQLSLILQEHVVHDGN